MQALEHELDGRGDRRRIAPVTPSFATAPFIRDPEACFTYSWLGSGREMHVAPRWNAASSGRTPRARGAIEDVPDRPLRSRSMTRSSEIAHRLNDLSRRRRGHRRKIADPRHDGRLAVAERALQGVGRGFS
jgi:hypothetical protein